MSTEDLTIEILQQIRADLSEVNRVAHAQMEATRERQAASDLRNKERQAAFDPRFEATQSRLVDAQKKVAAEFIPVSKTMGEVRDLLRDRLDQRDRVDDHERRIHAIERKPAPRGSRSK